MLSLCSRSGLVAVAIISQLIDDSVQPIETADYWPGFTEDEVIPDRHASRDEFQPLNWIGNGYVMCACAWLMPMAYVIWARI
jgi:hypothetical protein